MSSKVKQVVDAAGPVVKRDVNKWLYRVREFLMTRKFTHNQRHEFEMSKRTQPQPYLPSGFAHKLNKNYYFDRDARRQVGQPQVVFSSTFNQPLLASSAAQPQIIAAAGATAQQPPATSTNTSPFLTVLEAEKQTASYVVGAENAGQKTRNQLRTPGRVYNWDG